MPPTKGTKLRNFPSLSLEQSIAVPQSIQNQAAGRPVSRLTLAAILGRSPGSSEFERILMASRAFGMTKGGSRSDQFELTELGNRITGSNQVEQLSACRTAVLQVAPYKAFLETHNHRRVPAEAPFKDFLIKHAAVAEARAKECMEHILEDARFVGLTRTVKGGAEWIEFDMSSLEEPSVDDVGVQDDEDDDSIDEFDLRDTDPLTVADHTGKATNGHTPPVLKPTKVFIAHGKNHKPLDQLKKMLDAFKVPYAVAVDEPHAGRPISAKVANLMRKECSSGIFIFTADEEFTQVKDGEPKQVWRPSENVVFELGAASILYDNRIVIFKEQGVTFPSDFSDLGYITFESEQLVEQMGNLFQELVKLDILEVRAKG